MQCKTLNVYVILGDLINVVDKKRKRRFRLIMYQLWEYYNVLAETIWRTTKTLRNDTDLNSFCLGVVSKKFSYDAFLDLKCRLFSYTRKHNLLLFCDFRLFSKLFFFSLSFVTDAFNLLNVTLIESYSGRPGFGRLLRAVSL